MRGGADRARNDRTMTLKSFLTVCLVPLALVVTAFFLLPMAIIIMVLSWPMVVESIERNEYSSDAGGLLRWPVKILIPVGFFLLVLQGVSEIIKRVGFLSGHIPDPAERHHDPILDETIKTAAEP